MTPDHTLQGQRPTKPFVLFDLGETLVDLKELLVSLATNLANRYPNLRADIEDIVRRWIVEGSRAMPRAPGQPFVAEFEVASGVMAKLLRERGIRLTEGEAGTILREGWDDFETRVRFVGGVTEAWLREIRGLSAGLAIVTDGDRENVERLLRESLRRARGIRESDPVRFGFGPRLAGGRQPRDVDLPAGSTADRRLRRPSRG